MLVYNRKIKAVHKSSQCVLFYVFMDVFGYPAPVVENNAQVLFVFYVLICVS